MRLSRLLLSAGNSSGEWLARQASDPYVRKAREAGYRARSAFKLLEINDQVRLIRPGDVVVDLGAAPGGWSQVAARACGSNASWGQPIDVTAFVQRTSTPSVNRALAPSGISRRVSILSIPSLERAVRDDREGKGGYRDDRTAGQRTAAKQVGSQSGVILPSLPPGAPIVIAVDISRMEPLPGTIVLLGDFTTAPVAAAIRSVLGTTEGVDVVLSDMAHSFTGDSSLDHSKNMALAWHALLFASAHLSEGGAFLAKVRYGEQYGAFRKAVARRFNTWKELKPPSSRQDSAEAFLLGQGYKPAALHGSADTEEKYWLHQLGLLARVTATLDQPR